MSHLDELHRLAQEAAQMPWDKSPSDVPYAARKALQDAMMRNDTAKKLIAVAKLADALVNPPQMTTGYYQRKQREEDEAALRAALEELK